MTFVNEKLNDNIKKFRKLIDGRATILTCGNKEYEYNIVNTYAPPSDVNEYVQFATKYFNAVRNIDNSI